jgi:Tfp pilus assembly protein PilN
VTDCDFIPAKYHQKRAIQRTLKRRSAGVGGMFAVMIIWMVAHHRQLSVAEAMLVDVTSQQDQLSQIASRKAELEKEQAKLIAHEQLIGQLSGRTDTVIVLSEVTRCMPESVVLTEAILNGSFLAPYLIAGANFKPAAANTVEPTADQVAKTPAEPIRAEKLRMAGIAPSSAEVIEFAAALERSGLFDKVFTETVESTVWNSRKAERFEMSCELIPHERSKP